jgi:hypothetical protein
MGRAMRSKPIDTPAAKAMDEAIRLAIEGDSPYPECGMFIDEGMPYTKQEMDIAAEEGFPAILVSPDGSFRTVWPEAPAA